MICSHYAGQLMLASTPRWSICWSRGLLSACPCWRN